MTTVLFWTRGLATARLWAKVLIGRGTLSLSTPGLSALKLPGGSNSQAHSVPDWPPSEQVFLAQPTDLVAFHTTWVKWPFTLFGLLAQPFIHPPISLGLS